MIILNQCFSKCKNLKSFSVLSSKNICIGIGAFEGIINLETISFKAENKIEIYDYCFGKVEKLKEFNFSCNEAIFHENCFYVCVSLKNFKNQNTNKILFYKQVFCCCDNLEEVEITTKTEFEAGNYCFDRLMNLKKVTINSPKVKIGDFCFNSCASLSTLSFPNAKEMIYYDSYVFNCSDLNIFINPDAIKKIMKSEKLEINKPFIDKNNES